MKIGLLTSVGRTIDAFFEETVAVWGKEHTVRCAAGTPPASAVPFDLIDGLTQRPAWANLGVPSRLERWARQHDLDVIVTNTATASTLVRLRAMPCKVVYFCHGLHWNRGWHPAQVVERVLAPRADSVITINSDDHAWFSQRHRNVAYLREGVGVPASYRWTALPADGRLELVWAGDFVARKRPVLAVQVVSELARLGCDVHLTMLGDGPMLEETRAAAAGLGTGHSISFPGRADVRPLISNAHALLHTATWEGLPRILLEGAAMGRQAFAFDVKGVRDVPHAVLAPDADVSALAELVASQRPERAVDPESAHSFRSDEVALKILDHLKAVVAQG